MVSARGGQLSRPSRSRRIGADWVSISTYSSGISPPTRPNVSLLHCWSIFPKALSWCGTVGRCIVLPHAVWLGIFPDGCTSNGCRLTRLIFSTVSKYATKAKMPVWPTSFWRILSTFPYPPANHCGKRVLNKPCLARSLNTLNCPCRALNNSSIVNRLWHVSSRTLNRMMGRISVIAQYCTKRTPLLGCCIVNHTLKRTSVALIVTMNLFFCYKRSCVNLYRRNYYLVWAKNFSLQAISRQAVNGGVESPFTLPRRLTCLVLCRNLLLIRAANLFNVLGGANDLRFHQRQYLQGLLST